MKETIQGTVRSLIMNRCRNELGSSLKKKQVASKIVDRVKSLVSDRKSGFTSGFCSRQALIQNYSNFKNSGHPSRFMFFDNDEWNDFSEQVFGSLKDGFVAGLPVIDLSIDGSCYLFDFFRMLQIDTENGNQRSIAWMDVHGKCFFPKQVVGEGIRTVSELPLPKIDIEIRIGNGKNTAELRGDSSNSLEESSDESHFDDIDKAKRISLDKPCAQLENPNAVSEGGKWPYAVELKEGDKGYSDVKNLFLAGIRSSGPGVIITSISRLSHESALGKARLEAFQKQIELTKAARGRANVRIGWHGASVKRVEGIAVYGFEQPNNFSGSETYGVGVYLSPQESSHTSISLSEVDINGEKHVILCRVIMGNAEKVEAGSLQFHPSSEEFDTGVDDLKDPTWYIVWNTHMNRHILPEYVVSFKSLDRPQERPLPRNSIASRLSFPKLFSEMEKLLPSSTVQSLRSLYSRYKIGVISKDVLIRQLRLIAGDKLLVSTIRRLQGH